MIIKQLERFLSEIDKNIDNSQVFSIDGILINIKYSDGIIVKEFSIQSPLKKTNDYEFFKITLESMHKYLTTKNSKRYLRKLKKYL